MKKLFITFLLIFSVSWSFAQMQDTQINDISIYPNPVTDFQFYVSADQTVVNVDVLNVIGQTVKTVRNETKVPYNILVQLPNTKTGMYIVRVTTEDGETHMRKVLVK